MTTPVCGPSRASFLTGNRVTTLGITKNEGASGQFDPSQTIAVALQEQGYATALFGKYINGYRDQFPRVPPGWSEWRAMRDELFDLFSTRSLYGDPVFSWNGARRRDFGYSTDLIAEYGEEFIEENASRPFFLLLSFWAPHVPLVPADRHFGVLTGEASEASPSFMEEDMSDKPPWLARFAGLRDMTRWRERTAPRYIEVLLAVDEAVGRIRATLERLELDENTIIVFTSDNGFSLGEHWWIGKAVPYEESIRVPLVVWGGGFEPREDDRLVLNIDIAPTLAELAGGRIEADGRSLVALLEGRRPPWRWFFEVDWSRGFGLPETYRALRTRHLKLIEWEGGHQEAYLLSLDPNETRGATGTGAGADLGGSGPLRESPDSVDRPWAVSARRGARWRFSREPERAPRPPRPYRAS